MDDQSDGIDRLIHRIVISKLLCSNELKLVKKYQLARLLDIPLEIGLDLFALSFICIVPRVRAYLSSTPAFRCLYRKYPIPSFNGINAAVKNTMNLRYPVSYLELFPTSGGFHF